MKKLNKKGFTLIELLAVIAILAILIVIAVPGVLSLYNEGKISAFKTQAQNIWKSAENKSVVDEITGKVVTRYCGGKETSGTYKNELDLQGTKNIRYDIVIASGKVTRILIEQINTSGEAPNEVYTPVMRATGTSIDNIVVTDAPGATGGVDCSVEN